jgi:hypothetical protein
MEGGLTSLVSREDFFPGRDDPFSTLTPVSMRSADRANPETLKFTNISGLMSA